MVDTTGQEEFFRIKRLPPYVFESVNLLKAKLRKDGADIIDFGFGNPDMKTPQHIIDKLVETVQKPKTTGYSVSRGILGLRQACARYYKRRFDVDMDPLTEIVATIGSKEGFAISRRPLRLRVILSTRLTRPIHCMPMGSLLRVPKFKRSQL